MDYDDDFDAEDFAGAGDEDTATVPCPYCGEAIPEDTPRCPYCENYISREDVPPSRKPWWIVVGALGVLFAIYLWVTRH